MSIPRYPKYKDSGVEWLGEVPEGWEGTAIKRLCETITDGAHISPETEGGEFPFISTKDVRDDGIDFENCFLTSPTSYEYMVKTGCRPQPGDVLFSKDGTIGRTIVVEQGRDFVVASSLIIIRPNKHHLDSRFLSHLCQSDLVRSQVEAAVKGAGLPRLSITSLLKVIGCFPPIPEQTAIAAFLDRETAKIDGLVAEQRRLMELLKEKRQAVISHAVTKGLNPDAPMKESGIEWLGDVPAHWEVLQLKRVAEPGTSITYGIVQAGPDIEDGIPYIRTSDMAGDSLPETGYMRTTPEIDASYSRSKVRPNDLVVAIRASIGKGLLVPDFLDGANLTQGTARICPDKNLMPRFLLWSFNSDSCQTSIRVVAKGTTFLEITLDALRRIPLAVPPLPEQSEIVERLDEDVAKLDTLTAEAHRAIALLQERRTALISAAVTGQIDVRQFATNEEGA